MLAFFTRDHENDFPRQYDTDGSGEIEFPEFCNMMSQKMSQQDDAEMVKLVIYDDGENDNLIMAFWAFFEVDLFLNLGPAERQCDNDDVES